MQASSHGILRDKGAVLFDLFHTLVEVQPEGPAGRTTADILGVDRAEWSRMLWEDTHDRVVGIDRDPHHIIRRVAHQIDPSISEERIREAAASRLRRFALALIQVPPASVESVRRLRASGLKIGLVSNADVTEVAAWDRSPLAEHFHAAVFSCEVGEKKPDAAIYHIALERLGVQPEEAVFVGDGGSRELEGAKAVGLQTVMMRGIIKRLYPELVAERRPYADFEIDDPLEIFD